MATFTATSTKTGKTCTRSSKTVTYTHGRVFTFDDGTEAFTFHKSLQAATKGARPDKSWNNLPMEIVELTVS